MSKLSSLPWLLPESFVDPLQAPVGAPGLHGNRFGELADHFAEFRTLVACLAGTLPPGEDADAAWQVASGLEVWACFMDDAREAAARAPETDLVLARTWGARLADIVRAARHALKLDVLAAGQGSAVSIARHETAFPLSRLAEPPPQPAAGPTGRRPSRLRRRRR